MGRKSCPKLNPYFFFTWLPILDFFVSKIRNMEYFFLIFHASQKIKWFFPSMNNQIHCMNISIYLLLCPATNVDGVYRFTPVRPYVPIWLSFAFSSISQKPMVIYQWYLFTTGILYNTTQFSITWVTMTYISCFSDFFWHMVNISLTFPELRQ